MALENHLPRLHTDINVSSAERIASVASGAALTVLAARKPSIPTALMAFGGGVLLYRGATGHCPLFAAFGIDTANKRHSETSVMKAHSGIKVDATIVVDRPVALVYRFWRRFENLASFMDHLIAVRSMGDRSHWVAKGPAGRTVQWDAEIINEIENELIAWKSVGDENDIETAGSVHFESLNDDSLTRVHVLLKYRPPADKVGAAIARLFGENPKRQVRDDLLQFKKLIESQKFTENELSVLKRHSRRTPLREEWVAEEPGEVMYHHHDQEEVDEASEESFPASDSPSWPRGH